jgi:hypothetical protein
MVTKGYNMFQESAEDFKTQKMKDFLEESRPKI